MNREALREEVSARLLRVIEEQSLTAVVDADALRQADLLAGSLDGTEGTDEVQERHVLGWFYWCRFLAFRHEPDSEAHNRDVRNRALEMLTPCFVAGTGDLPEELLSELA